MSEINLNKPFPVEIKTFSPDRFEFLESLGSNHSAGRITHKARHLKSGQIVVIKEFTFVNSSWDGYKQIEKEINTLSRLNHPNIPKYLGKYEFEKSLFLVQEYIEAPSLATYGKLPLDEVKDIALSILDILVYLQSLNSPIFHRDIKPENILYQQESKEVYLVDFGLAKGVGTVGLSTMIGGTMGFMPPEQILGKKLSSASDLYSLGITLVCLLSGIPSSEINQLINHQFEIDFSKVIPNNVSWEFRDLLKNLTHPSQEQRFQSAFQAKQELINIELIVQLSVARGLSLYEC